MASPNPLYLTREWKLLRKQKLMEMPLCEYCKLAKATHVDHKKPHKGSHFLFFDFSNLQSLCHSCHSTKTLSLDGGFGKGKNPRPRPGADAFGIPLDENHHWRK